MFVKTDLNRQQMARYLLYKNWVDWSRRQRARYRVSSGACAVPSSCLKPHNGRRSLLFPSKKSTEDLPTGNGSSVAALERHARYVRYKTSLSLVAFWLSLLWLGFARTVNGNSLCITGYIVTVMHAKQTLHRVSSCIIYRVYSVHIDHYLFSCMDCIHCNGFFCKPLWNES